MSAAAAEKNPAEDGDVVAGPDHRPAARAVGAWADDGFVARQARDADVEAAAEGQAEDGGEDGTQQCHHAIDVEKEVRQEIYWAPC